MDTSPPGWPFRPSEKGKKVNHVFVLWVTVSITCGSGLEHLCGGVIFWQAFSEVESGPRQLPGEGLEMKLSTQTFQTLWA